MKVVLLGLVWCCACATLGATACDWQTLNPDKVATYIDKYKHIAIAEMDRCGVPASIKMAQGILESSAGESELATRANNHFGIKCGGDWVGTTHYVWDDEPVKSCFRVYVSPEECFIAHTYFLTNPKKEQRYGFLFKLPKTDYKAWAHGLQSAGYATSKTYAVKLIGIIERYELYKLDYLTLRKSEVTADELARIKELQDSVGKKNTEIPNPSDTTLVLADVDTNTTANPIIYPTGIVKIEQLEAVYAQAGESLDVIAKRHKISVKKLVKYNDLSEKFKAQPQLNLGDILYLQPKHKHYKGRDDHHIVRTGQTMHDIAQQHGIRLKTLYKLNRVYQHTQPNPSVIIRLR